MQKEGAAIIHTFILTETFEKSVDIIHEKAAGPQVVSSGKMMRTATIP